MVFSDNLLKFNYPVKLWLIVTKDRYRRKYIDDRMQAIEILVMVNTGIFILIQLHCIFTDSYALRIYLLDISLFIGNIRQYTISSVILFAIFTQILFEYVFYSPESQMRWIELFEVIAGQRNPMTTTLFNDGNLVENIKRFSAKTVMASIAMTYLTGIVQRCRIHLPARAGHK